MKPKSPQLGRLPSIAVSMFLVAAAILAWWQPGSGQSAFSGLEGRFLDLRYHVRGPNQPGSQVVIIAIDDETIERANRFPISRSDIGRAISMIDAAGASAIAIDLLFLQPGESGDDAALAAALDRADRVVLAMTGFWTKEGEAADAARSLEPGMRDALMRSAFDVVSIEGSAVAPGTPPDLLLPMQPFARHNVLGHVNILSESDGSLRRMPLDLAVTDTLALPSLPLAAARLHLGIPRGEFRLRLPGGVFLGPRHIEGDGAGAMAVNFHGGSGTIPTYPLIDVISGDIDPAIFRDKLVFIGVTGLGTGDTFATPFADTLPGVEVMATAAENIIEGTELRRGRLAGTLDWCLALAGAGLVFMAANRANLWLAAAATLAVWLAFAFVVYAGFSEFRLWLDATTILLALATATFGTFAARIFLQKRISTRLMFERQNLARYHSPFLAETLARTSRPSFDDRPQPAAVVFVDVAGFTTLSEQLGPAATVAFLRRLHEVFESCAIGSGGVIEQFMGDGAMIVFGLPEPTRADSAAALACARELISAVDTLNASKDAAVPVPVRIRVSVHFGEVVAAVLGGQTQGHATVAGDVVNVSSRLQEIAKAHDAVLIISQALRAAVLQTDRPELVGGLTPLEGVSIRGREGLIDAWIWKRPK